MTWYAIIMALVSDGNVMAPASSVEALEAFFTRSRGRRGAAPHPTSQPPPGGFITGPRDDAQPKEKKKTQHY